MPRIHIHIHDRASWEESQHPRRTNGQFGRGSVPTAAAKPKASAIERAKGLSREDARIESHLADKVEHHYHQAAREYAGLPDAMGGKVLNTDVARELSPHYMKDRTKSAAVHEPASWFIKKLYAQRLADMPKEGRVVFTSGGTGSGKTTAINGVEAAKQLQDEAHVVYDTNMNTEASAVKKIEQALAAGGHVHIIHVQRDPVDALVNGALKRAMSQREKFGTGRTVPLVEHAKTHVGAAQTIQALAERYADNPRVHIGIIDNTRGKGKAALADLDFIRRFDYSDMEGKLHAALDAEHAAGRITTEIHRATKG